MTPALQIALGFHGIHTSTNRATCPECSATRRKASDKCLRIKVISDTTAIVNCKHCPYRERIQA